MIWSSILGGITGLFGNIVGAFFKYKQGQLDIEKTKLQNAHELEMTKAETEAMVTEAKANIKITEATVEGKVDIEDSKAYLTSQQEGNKNLFDNKWIDGLLNQTGWWKIITLPLASLIATLFGLVDFIRMLIRPSLTVYLVGVTSYITWMAWKIMHTAGVAITSAQAVGIFTSVTDIVVYLTVSCVLWWFGDRRLEKALIQKNLGYKTALDKEVKI